MEASPFYLPILKSKQGEWHALRRVTAADRLLTFPLIEFTTLKIGPQQAAGPALVAYLDRVGDWLSKVDPKNWTLGIDTSNLLPTLPKQTKLLATVCARLSKGGYPIAPCLLPTMIQESPTDAATLAQYDDIILRIPVQAYLPEQVQKIIQDAWECVKRKGVRLHVLLDMYDQVGVDPVSLAATSRPYCHAAVSAPHAHSVTVAGGSFPFNLTGFSQGITNINRVEWRAWIELRKDPIFHALQFGDYAVTNPRPQEEIDPRKVNAAAAIRYAQKDHWLLFKAGGTRTSGFGQYNGLCALLIGDSRYAGAAYSYGDERYSHHAVPTSTSGSLWTWRRDATSHHLALTARHCASLISP